MLDYFERFLDGVDEAARFAAFIKAARASRLGLHQDVLRTKKIAKFRELLSGEVTEAVPSVVEYGRGEILLARMLTYADEVYVFGDPKGFPREARNQIKEMVRDKMSIYARHTEGTSETKYAVHEARRALLDVMRHPER
jgi:hypothetical protein